MTWTVIGVFLLVLNAYYVLDAIRKNTITKGTLLNAVAVGCVMTTLLWVQYKG